MSGEGEFQYYTNQYKVQTTDTLAYEVPSVGTKSELMETLSTGLLFPAYFGRNWDALDAFKEGDPELRPAPILDFSLDNIAVGARVRVEASQ